MNLGQTTMHCFGLFFIVTIASSSREWCSHHWWDRTEVYLSDCCRNHHSDKKNPALLNTEEYNQWPSAHCHLLYAGTWQTKWLQVERTQKKHHGYLVSFFSLCALQSFLAFWTLKKIETWKAASADETKIQHQNYMIWSLKPKPKILRISIFHGQMPASECRLVI